MKLNTDRCSKGSVFLVGDIDVNQDNNMQWCYGFFYNIGTCTPIEAELWGVCYGLCVA